MALTLVIERVAHRRRVGASVAVAGVLALAATAGAQVDCSNADNLCTGDPCVTSLLTVQTPCIVDFSPRTLIIGDILVVPNNGTLQFTAAAIEVNGKIAGNHVQKTAGDGADISLIASGNITIRKRIDVSGRFSNGSITLDAGGNVALEQQLRARAKGTGATATGGTVTVTADGTLSSIRRGRVDVRGQKKNTNAGQASFDAGGDIALNGRVEARGAAGGIIVVASSSGNVVIVEELRAQGDPNAGGSVTVTADGSITMGGRKGRALTSGSTGGPIVLTGASADLQRTLSARGRAGSAGSLTVTTSGSVSLLRFFGRAKVGAGGAVTIDAGGPVTIGRLVVTGPDGGAADVDAGSDVSIGDVDAEGDVNGGTLLVKSSGGDVELFGDVDLDGRTSGGEMRVTAPAGNIALGSGISSDFEVDGPAGGVIDAQAGANLTAIGEFRAEIGGCIGLSAGGTLDTSLATFDVTPVASCP